MLFYIFEACIQIGKTGKPFICGNNTLISNYTIFLFTGRRKPRVHRPRSPILEEKDIPPLEFPKSSEDLMVPNEHIMNVIAIYEVLRNFGTVLRLSPFRFEDFCASPP